MTAVQQKAARPHSTLKTTESAALHSEGPPDLKLSSKRKNRQIYRTWSNTCQLLQVGRAWRSHPHPATHKPVRDLVMQFPRSLEVAAIIFPHTKWLKKITDYRDTPALKQALTC